MITSYNIYLQNDEGSPLMCLSDSGVWQLHGVLSYHGVCEGDTARPAIFTGIDSVREWIWSTVGKCLCFSRSNNDLQILFQGQHLTKNCSKLWKP